MLQAVRSAKTQIATSSHTGADVLVFSCYEFRPPRTALVSPIECPGYSNTRYIEEGYSITLTDAPNVLGGRLLLNCALTTPALPTQTM